MCIICLELNKNKLSPWEAKKNLGEMVEKIGEKHARDVEVKISELIYEEISLNYGDTISEDVEDTTVGGFTPKTWYQTIKRK